MIGDTGDGGGDGGCSMGDGGGGSGGGGGGGGGGGFGDGICDAQHPSHRCAGLLMPETPQDCCHSSGGYKQTYSRFEAVGTASHATLSSELHDCTLKLPLNAHPTHVFEQLGGVGDAMRVKRRREPRSLPPHAFYYLFYSHQ